MMLARITSFEGEAMEASKAMPTEEPSTKRILTFSLGYAMHLPDTFRLIDAGPDSTIQITHAGRDESTLEFDGPEDEQGMLMETLVSLTKDWSEGYLPSGDVGFCDGFEWELSIEDPAGEQSRHSCGENAFGPSEEFCKLLDIVKDIDEDFAEDVTEVWRAAKALCDPNPIHHQEVFDAYSHGDASLNIGAEYYQEAMSSPSGDHKLEAFKEAKRWYEASEKFGNLQATTNLGYIHAYGRTGERDYQKAYECFKRASDAGNAEATFKLGDLVRAGHGCEASETRSFDLYRKAHELSSDAHFPEVWGGSALRMAECYENGIGCEDDPQKALDLYLEAEVGLGEAIESGMGWYQKEYENACKAVERLTMAVDANDEA